MCRGLNVKNTYLEACGDEGNVVVGGRKIGFIDLRWSETKLREGVGGRNASKNAVARFDLRVFCMVFHTKPPCKITHFRASLGVAYTSGTPEQSCHLAVSRLRSVPRDTRLLWSVYLCNLVPALPHYLITSLIQPSGLYIASIN